MIRFCIMFYKLNQYLSTIGRLKYCTNCNQDCHTNIRIHLLFNNREQCCTKVHESVSELKSVCQTNKKKKTFGNIFSLLTASEPGNVCHSVMNELILSWHSTPICLSSLRHHFLVDSEKH